MELLIAAVAGCATWSFLEYMIHRFDGHKMKGNTPFSAEHLAHHADPDYFAPSWKKAGAAVVITAVMGALTRLVVADLTAAVYTVSFVAMYLTYEFIHRRLHTHGPMGPYGRWARRHHFIHHFHDANTNHGVTSPIWDWVFGTLVTADTVTIPHRRAPAWMLEDQQLRQDLVGDYRLKGRARA